MTRSVIYISGSRADFGLMRRTLDICSKSSELDISVLATGQHLLTEYGRTIREVEKHGFRIAGTVPVQLGGMGGAQMARAIGEEVVGITQILEAERPSIVLLLGDRGEMLAGAIAALHVGIPSVHIHGGELSGSVDEPVRHAISKLSHLHLAATEGARERLHRLGEQAHRVFVVGAPGLDDVFDHKPASRREVASTVGFDPSLPMAVLLYHPVVQDPREGGHVMDMLLDTLASENFQVLVLLPNSDAGGAQIDEAWTRFERRLPDDLRYRFHAVDHLPRDRYLDWVAASDVVIGNSSSGIIESVTLRTPCVNVGSRQQHRERNRNTIEVRDFNKPEVQRALRQALALEIEAWPNVYGDGQSSRRIFSFLTDLDLTLNWLQKHNAY